MVASMSIRFFFNDTATTEIYTLSLHDALPISKYGFCSGVRIADLKVKRFAAGGGRAAMLGQVVHNERVVEEMESLGVRTHEGMAAGEAPTINISAHGAPPSFHDTSRAARPQIPGTT